MHVRWHDPDKQPAVPNNKKSGDAEGSDVKGGNKHRGSQKDDLFKEVYPMYYLSKICGILPLRFTEVAPRTYQGKLCLLDVLYSLCVLALVLGSEIWGFWRDLKDGWENSTRLKSKTAVIATCSDVLGVMTLASISVIDSFLRWKYLLIVVDKLLGVDEKLEHSEPKRTRRFSIVLATCTLTYLLVASTLDFHIWQREARANKKMPDKGPVNYVAMYLMYIIIIVMEMEYALFTYNVGQRFARLNKSLDVIMRAGRITEHFRKDLGVAGDFRDQGQAKARVKHDLGTGGAFRKTKIVDWYPVTDNRNIANGVPELVAVHAALCDAVVLINSAYGLAMLAVTLTCLLHLIITPYVLIMQADRDHEWLFLLVQSLWVIWHVIRMLIVVQPTYAATAEAKKTAIIVSQLLSSEPDAKVQRQLEYFSLQLLHRPIEFSACGLFSLDRALVTSIAGAVTTYLVILIQFQKADDSKGSFESFVKDTTSQILKNASSLHNLTALNL